MDVKSCKGTYVTGECVLFMHACTQHMLCVQLPNHSCMLEQSSVACNAAWVVSYYFYSNPYSFLKFKMYYIRMYVLLLIVCLHFIVYYVIYLFQFLVHELVLYFSIRTLQPSKLLVVYFLVMIILNQCFATSHVCHALLYQ